MPRNQEKNYQIRSVGNQPICIEQYRKAPWLQRYCEKSYDFRRWLYFGRPKLDEQDNKLPTVHGNLLLAGRDEIVEAIRDAIWKDPTKSMITKESCCRNGVNVWFEFLDYCAETDHPVCKLTDITQDIILEYIHWLKNIKKAKTETGSLSYVGASSYYLRTKAIFVYMTRQRVLPEGLFPRNPFPGLNRAVVGHKPYSKKVVKALIVALYKDLEGLQKRTLKISDIQVLTIYLLLIAVRTGRNPTPLLELTRDAVKDHPIKPERLGVLVTHKRRGNNTSVQAFERRKQFEEIVSISMDVLNLYKKVVSLTEPLLDEAPHRLRDCLWIYRQTGSGRGTKRVNILTQDKYFKATRSIIARHDLRDENDEPLSLNISRLRKTFAQRMWELTGGDIVAVAEQLGNTPPVAGRTYVSTTPEMKANFRRVGFIMHADWADKLDDEAFLAELSHEMGIPAAQLRSIAIGNNNTGVGRCTDPIHGEMASGDGTHCTRWLECFYCPNQLVMEPDLYRMFSFYFLLLKERNFISRIRWEENYGPILYIIDHEIIAPNLKTKDNPKGCFDPYRVQKCREEAEVNPHPMWRDRTILGGSCETV